MESLQFGPHAVHALSGDETANFSYDANGNALTGNTSNSYNLADQLVKAVKGSAIVEFAYAPDGDRYVWVNGDKSETNDRHFLEAALFRQLLFRQLLGCQQSTCWLSAFES